MKHFYEKVDGFMLHSNKLFFEHVLENLDDNIAWVEIGSYKGKSAAFCYVELLNKCNNFNFTCVDLWDNDNIYQSFCSNLDPIINDINVIKDYSWNAANSFANESIDFAYIDADHSFEGVVKDINAWYPKIKLGGYIGGDDMTKTFPGVAQAVKQKFGNNFKKLKRCWIVKKS